MPTVTDVGKSSDRRDCAVCPEIPAQRPSASDVTPRQSCSLDNIGAARLSPDPYGLARHWRIAMSASDGSNFSRRSMLKSGVYASVGLAVAGSGIALAADKSLPLITKAVPSTKEKLPVIGVGTNAFGVSAPDEVAARREVLAKLPELGGAVVDTAQAYGTSEAVIGEQVASIGNRAKLFLATKTPLAGDVADAKATIEKSFAALRTDKIDLLQIHNVHGVEQLLPLYKEYKKGGRFVTSASRPRWITSIRSWSRR